MHLTRDRYKTKCARKAGERGAVMIEGALIFTVFFFLLIGIFDFSQFLFLHQALVERARGAARWGLVNDPTNTTSIQNMVLYNQSATGTTPYFGLSTSNVAVSNPGAGTDDYRLVVQINNYRYTMLSPYIGGSYQGPNITIAVPIGQ
jgi:Flp pilus assembly protein TadG